MRNNLFIFPVKLQSEPWDFGELCYLYYKSLAAMLGSCTVELKLTEEGANGGIKYPMAVATGFFYLEGTNRRTKW